MADKQLVAHARLWETADGRVVEEGDPDAAFLLAAGEGSVIDPARAERLGLKMRGERVHQSSAPEGEPVPSIAADKEPARRSAAAEPDTHSRVTKAEEQKAAEQRGSIHVEKGK